jgi:hypothetical protein
MRLSSWRSDCGEADGVLQEHQSFRAEVAEFRFVNGHPSIRNLDLARGLNAQVSGDATFRAAFDRLYKVEHDLDRASRRRLWLRFLFKHLGLFGCKYPLHRTPVSERSRRQPRKLSRAR